MEFVLFHVASKMPSKKNGQPRLMIKQFFASAARHHLGCRKVVLTDLHTDLSFLSKDVEVHRYDVNPAEIAMSRWIARLRYLRDHNFSNHIVFSDYDMFINADLEPLFERDFDIALTYRVRDPSHRRPELKINGGVLFLKKGSRQRSLPFLEKVLEVYQTKYFSRPDWWGGQYSLNEVVGHSRIPNEGEVALKLGEATVLILPCAIYNFSPEDKDAACACEWKDKKILHFKGQRRQLMQRYWHKYIEKDCSLSMRLLRVIKGFLAPHIHQEQKRAAYANLKRKCGHTYAPPELKKILKKYYRDVCQERIKPPFLWQDKENFESEKKVLILSDGVLGHLKQCQAVFHQLKEVYAKKGIPKEKITCEVLQIKLKTKIAKKLVFRLTYFPLWFCQGCMRCLKFVLDREDYDRLMRMHADVVLSAFGKRTIALNLLLSLEYHAKSVVVMNPRSAIKRFDLAICHAHDRIKVGNRKNVIFTQGAPNVMNQKLSEPCALTLREQLSHLRAFKIGLLLGGNYKHFKMKEERIAKLIHHIKDAAQNTDADILATTSRRTPKNIEDLLKRQLADDPRCQMLILANDDNKENMLEGILGLCDAVVVSPESVSMVSEAASSGAHVLVYNDETFLTEKHKLFLKNLVQQNYIRLSPIEQISRQIKEFYDERRKTKVLDDNIIIKEALAKIV